MKLVPLTDMDYLFHRKRKEIWIDPDAYVEDPMYAVAYVFAQIDLDHLDDGEDMFTADQEAFADTLAQVRLDREGSR